MIKVVWIGPLDDNFGLKFHYEYLIDDLLKLSKINIHWIDSSLPDGQRVSLDKCLVVFSSDSRVLDTKLCNYFKQCYEDGNKFILIHTSNEQLNHNSDYYNYAEHVFRCYLGYEYLNKDNISILPIGYQTGFKRLKEIVSFKDKQYSCNFIGHPKNERYALINVINRIKDSFVHTTTKWNCPTQLSKEQMSDVMAKSLVTPIPMGNVHIETHRLYESLEAGSIPVVRTYGDLNYYKLLFGDNPLPTVASWEELPEVILRFSDENTYNNKVKEIQDWYENLKKSTSENIVRQAAKLV